MSEAQTWKAPPVGTPCWIEIHAADVPACKKFYSELFSSWEFKPATVAHSEEKIAMWSFSGPMGLTGGITQVPAASKRQEQTDGIGFTVILFVESIEETEKRIVELGGVSAGPKEQEGENGEYQYFKDVAGNRFGIYQMKK